MGEGEKVPGGVMDAVALGQGERVKEGESVQDIDTVGVAEVLAQAQVVGEAVWVGEEVALGQWEALPVRQAVGVPLAQAETLDDRQEVMVGVSVLVLHPLALAETEAVGHAVGEVDGVSVPLPLEDLLGVPLGLAQGVALGEGL